VNIVNIDISSVVVNQMTDRYADREDMEFSVMDGRNLEYLPDSCFNIIIDKGLLDATLCGEKNIKNLQDMTKEMYRVLKPGGVYIAVSYGLPTTRMNYLTAKGLGWAVEFKKIAKPRLDGSEGDSEGSSETHFLYIARKK
jgi:ubiquinone/menaquinone biosynthesis C-methylase UbiE